MNSPRGVMNSPGGVMNSPRGVMHSPGGVEVLKAVLKFSGCWSYRST